MKTVEVIGVHARARCYNGGAALAAAPEVDVTDPLGLEAAFDSSFSIPKTSKPTATAGDDSLGLEEAFDVAFGDLAAGDEDQSDSTEPEISASSDDASDESRAGLAPGMDDEENITDMSDNGDGDGADDGEGGPLFTPEDRRHVRKLRRLPGFARERLNVKWRGRIIGNLTAWGQNISCVCRVHARCRSPAARDWPADTLLEDWLLTAINDDGTERMDREAHNASIRGVQQRIRARNRS